MPSPSFFVFLMRIAACILLCSMSYSAVGGVPDCLNVKYATAKIQQCLPPGLTLTARFPWDAQFFSFIQSVRQLGHCQVQEQITEAYRCIFNAGVECARELQLWTAKKGKIKIASEFNDIHLYTPDVDNLQLCLQLLCEDDSQHADEIASECDRAVIRCGLDMLSTSMSVVVLFNSQQPLSDIKNTSCRMFVDYHNCIKDLMQCSEEGREKFSKLSDYLIPPACHPDYVRTSDPRAFIDTEEKAEQEIIHDEM